MKRGWLGFGIFVILVGLLVFILNPGRGKVRQGEKTEIKEEFRNIRLEVINAAGRYQLARKVTFILREKGFDVVYFGSSKERLEHTVIVERADSTLKNAKLLGEVIGCKNYLLEIDPDKLLEVSLLLGGDYKKYFPGIDTLVILY
jgi:hypothetical protein